MTHLASSLGIAPQLIKKVSPALQPTPRTSMEPEIELFAESDLESPVLTGRHNVEKMRPPEFREPVKKKSCLLDMDELFSYQPSPIKPFSNPNKKLKSVAVTVNPSCVAPISKSVPVTDTSLLSPLWIRPK